MNDLAMAAIFEKNGAAVRADARAAAEGKRLADYDYFRAGTEYNAADCRSMSLVLAWLREHR